jgi:hypothetical protein
MTPNKNYFYGKIDQLDEVKYSDIKDVEVGDFVYVPRVRGSITGFVKKVGRVNLILEAEYGGWADQDIHLLELKVRKDEVTQYMKPKLITV